MAEITISQLQTSDDLAAATKDISQLLPQLVPDSRLFDEARLRAMLDFPGLHFWVARDNGRIIGTIQLSEYPLAHKAMHWVDNVVVDHAYRGQGIASRLLQTALDAAVALGWTELNLTSNPSREAANHVYGKMGFERYETNYWRYSFVEPVS